MQHTKLLLIYCFVLLLAGCGEQLPATVSGTITVDGQPLPEDANTRGSVFFYPTARGAAAFGQVTRGGRYSVSTGSTKGLEPGDYVVTVSITEYPPEPPGGFENPPNGRLISPASYADRELSDLKFTVEPGKNVIELQLKTQ